MEAHIGKAGEPIKKEHDWYELASAMALYGCDDSQYRSLREQGRLQDAQELSSKIWEWNQA